MLYRFKSKSSGDVIMVSSHARAILRLLGKDEEGPGILLVDQMPAAMAALRLAIAAESTGGASVADPAQGAAAASMDGDEPDSVSLRQRAWPLMQMIERSMADGHDIVWGV